MDVTKGTFEKLDMENKLNVVYDYLYSIHEKQTAQFKKCDERFKKIESVENKKVAIQTGASAVGGIGGGILAVYVYLKFFLVELIKKGGQ